MGKKKQCAQFYKVTFFNEQSGETKQFSIVETSEKKAGRGWPDYFKILNVRPDRRLKQYMIQYRNRDTGVLDWCVVCANSARQAAKQAVSKTSEILSIERC